MKRRLPPNLRNHPWHFHARLRLEAGGSITIHTSREDVRLERRRIRPAGRIAPVDVYFFDGEPMFSPNLAASRAALAAPLPAPAPPHQQDLFG